MKSLAVICTHPIQYYTPLFQLLANEKGLRLKVFYTWGKESLKKYDPGFKQIIQWDVPLLDGYDFEFLTNTSKNPGTHHFNGIINPGAIDKIADFKPDVILIYGWSYQSHLRILLCFRGKTKIWFRGDSTLLDRESLLKKFIKKRLLRWVYGHVDKAFYVGINNRNYFEHYGLYQSQLHFSPHVVDNDRFFIDYSSEAQEIRNGLGISKNQKLILFAGKFEPKKDPILLLRAFIGINQTNTHILFVGNGVLEKQLKHLKTEFQQLAESGLRVHFMAFQNQMKMPHIYQASDLFCLPSKGPGETWGLAVNEAMASGKPVLVSDKVGCAIDLVRTDVNGAIFIAGDEVDLSRKLKHLITSPRLGEYGIKSREIIKNWSLERSLQNIILEIKKTQD